MTHFCAYYRVFNPIESLRWNQGIFDNDNQYHHPDLGKLVGSVRGKRSN